MKPLNHIMMRFYTVLLLIVSLLAGYHAQAQSVNGTIWINDGAAYTNDPEAKVLVRVEAQNASEMIISSDPNFSDANWESYRMLVRAVSLKGGDGIKKVYAKFKDARGNVSPVTSAEIELDRQPPVGAAVEAKRSADGSLAVDLKFKAQDATKMRISNHPNLLGANWIKFQTDYPGWPVSGGSGKKTVYVQFADQIDNRTEIISGSTTFDLTPPKEPSILLNKGAKYATSPKVQVELNAEGASEMMLSTDNNWTAFRSIYQWDLSSAADGKHQIKAKFRDKSKNETNWVMAEIILDQKKPENPQISINNGDKITTDKGVYLTFSAIDAAEMIVANDQSFANAKWVTYQRNLHNWELAGKDGEKTVYVKFKDVAGNESEVASAKIALDATPPTGASIKIHSENTIIQGAAEKKYIADINQPLRVNIAGEGATEMMISHYNNFKDATWQPFQPSINWPISEPQDGAHFIFLRLKDAAGHVTTPVSDEYYIDTQAPINCSVAIDDDKDYCTNSERKVNLKLTASAATEMKIFNDGQIDAAKWQKYQEEALWKLSEGEGAKQVGVIFKDFLGNESQPVYDVIKLDNSPPLGGQIVIDKDAKVTNDPDKKVIINVQATDAVLMQVSNDPSFTGSRWEGFTQNNYEHYLSGEDGKKTVYVRFMDLAGNISKVISDDIYLDRTPPTNCSVLINGGKQMNNSNNSEVQLTLAAVGASEMQISNSPAFTEDGWISFKTSMSWTLSPGDGQKQVYVQYRDEVGNKSKICYDKIGLDTKAPKNGKVVINNGDEYCTNLDRKVVLSLHAQEATEMMIANTADFQQAEWQPFQILVQNFILSPQDGTKMVHVKFKDDAGNITSPVSDEIILDTQQPVIDEIVTDQGSSYTNSIERKITVEMKVQDAYEMIFSNDKYFKPPYKWEAFIEKKEWQLPSGDGPKKFYIRFRDRAGNESLTQENVIILDTQAPVIRKVLINKGKSVTETSEVMVSIEAIGAAEMRISNERTMSGAEWKPFLSTFRWSLSSGEGGKFVYVQLRDMAGNESTVESGFITVDPQ